MTTDAAPRIRFDRLRKAFPGVLALDDVSFDIAPGSIHAIAGENGAGKSTLIKTLAGAHRPDAGQVHIDNRSVSISDPRAARRLGIAVVHQEFNLIDQLSVAENIHLGRLPRRFAGLIDSPALYERSQALLSSLDMNIPLRIAVAGLTVAQRQMIEIAKALSQDARILILDEPSAVLTPHELTALFTLVRNLRERGASIIYISHRLDEVFDLADMVTVMRDGRHVSTRRVRDTGRDKLIAEMVGRPLTDEFPKRRSDIGPPVLRVDNLCSARRFHDVTFEVRAGEVFALTGLIGSGRSSVLQAIFGACPVSHGRVAVRDRIGPFKNPRHAIGAGIACLPEDRKRDGLLHGRSIRENISLANLPALRRRGLIDLDAERRIAVQSMRDMRIKAPSAETPVDALSGGNQQKVILARWMNRSHDVILFDEPTRGIDVGAKYEIYELINDLAARGAAIVMVSSELPEVIGMADRIAVMHEGRLATVLDNGSRRVTQHQIMTLASGLGSGCPTPSGCGGLTTPDSGVGDANE